MTVHRYYVDVTGEDGEPKRVALVTDGSGQVWVDVVGKDAPYIADQQELGS